jgi:integral membrane protein
VSPRTFYRSLATAEALTWTLLIAGIVAKYGFKAGPLPVAVAGTIHGIVFVAYLLCAVMVGTNQHWSRRKIATAMATAFLPYATIPFDRHLERHGRLDGGWRTAATADPRDHTLRSKALRVLVNRPVLLVPGFAVVVGAIVTALLVVGPPGGRS